MLPSLILFGSRGYPKWHPGVTVATACHWSVVSKDDSSSNSMVRNVSATSTIVKTFALVRSGSFSSIVNIVYLGLRMALFLVWPWSMHIRSFPFGFSLTRMFETQFVGCVTGFIMPSLQSLSNSSFTLSRLATWTRRTWTCPGLTLGYSLLCMGVPRGFPRLALNAFE